MINTYKSKNFHKHIWKVREFFKNFLVDKNANELKGFHWIVSSISPSCERTLNFSAVYTTNK